MDRTPLVSIVIVTYNRAKLLTRTVESIKAQTHTNWECIIVEDHSPDGTGMLIDEWSRADSRIRPIHYPEPVKGEINIVRNVGLREARGEFIGMCDDDDVWAPTKLEKQLQLFAQDSTGTVGFVGCDAIQSDELTGIETRLESRYHGNVLRTLLEHNISLNGSIMLMRAQPFRDAGFYDEAILSSDQREVWIKLAGAGYTYDHVPEPLVTFYVHGSNEHLIASKDRLIRRAYDLEHVFKKHRALWEREDMLGRGLRAVAAYFLIRHQYRQSRNYYMQALRHRPSDAKSYAGLALACTGAIGTMLYRHFVRHIR
jgi:glycosyltransferase involved in cell wall biosynthesis